jgi:hypothetical protein
MRRLVVAAWCGAVVVLAACSGGGGDSGAVATSAVGSTALAVATTTAVPVEVTSTTALPTTTSELVTTTSVATEDLIRQAVQDYFVRYHACLQVPSECVPESFLARQGSTLQLMKEALAEMVKRELYVGDDLQGAFIVVESQARVESEVVRVMACWFDAAVVFGPVGPDLLPTVVNDEIRNSHHELTLYLENGVWRVGIKVKTPLPEGQTCSAK